ALAVLFALAYLAAGLARAGARLRAALLGSAAAVLVAAPTLAFVAMGLDSGRPYGQDGGVVQLPLAIDKILAGQSPYGADYSDSILGKQARVSDFWDTWGGNPILHHHAYLPGTHLLMLPFHLASRAALGAFDPRLVTLLGFAAAALLAFRVAGGAARGLAAAAAVLVSPLVYWQQVFGANDVLVAALLLGAIALVSSGRGLAAAAVLGLACATKQLAWPFAPFLLAHLSGARSFAELGRAPARGRLLRAAALALGVFILVVAPVALLDPRAFWGDIVVYNVGLPGADNYPLGGTPGFGFANFIIYFGGVASLRDHVSFAPFYLLLIPLGLQLLREQLRAGTAAAVAVTGSVALLASLYFSRVVHPNYLVIAAILLPAGFLAGYRRRWDVAAVPLLLLLLAVEIAEGAIFRTTWEDALLARLPQYLHGLERTLAPRAGPGLTQDPLGLLFSAVAAALALAWLVFGVLGAGRRVRLALAATALVAVAMVPARTLGYVGTVLGAPRAQDAWYAQVTPRPALEAWSLSFRRDPPAPLEPTAAPAGPGERALARLALALGGLEPRLLTLVGLVLVVTLFWLRARDALPPALLTPALLTGLVFGSGDVFCLLAVIAGAWLARAERWWPAGAALGAGAALAPQVWCVAPLLLAPTARSRGATALAALGVASGLLVLMVGGGFGFFLPFAPG
ncbi:MAG TPA: glycosyltransferase 87 family protein, partial [Vicinamibacteria bacterium]